MVAWLSGNAFVSKKRRDMCKSGPLPGLMAYWPSRLKALVAMGPANMCRMLA